MVEERKRRGELTCACAAERGRFRRAHVFGVVSPLIFWARSSIRVISKNSQGKIVRLYMYKRVCTVLMAVILDMSAEKAVQIDTSTLGKLLPRTPGPLIRLS